MFKKILLFFMCAAIMSGVAITTGCTPIGNAGITESVGEITDETGKNLNDGVIHDMPAQLLFNPQTLSTETEVETALKVTLRATITPENATNKAVDWSISFITNDLYWRDWSADKTPEDYVTVTPTEDGSLIAEVECKQGFLAPLKITVTSRDNSEAKAECRVDYKQKFNYYRIGYGITFHVASGDKHFVLTARTDKDYIFRLNVHAVGGICTIPLTVEDVNLPEKAVFEFDEALKTALDQINPTWSNEFVFDPVDKISPTFGSSYSSNSVSNPYMQAKFNLSGYIFDKSFIKEKFNTEETRNAYLNVLHNLAGSSQRIVGAFKVKFYDKNDDYMFCACFDISTSTLPKPKVTSVESVSLDNDNLTM